MVSEERTWAALKPCPFCGGAATVICNGPTAAQVECAIAWAEDYDVSYFVQCKACQATSSDRRSSDNAITTWNTRAALEAAEGVSPDALELQRRLDAAKKRAGDIKGIHTRWTYGRDTRPIEKIMDEIEHIVFSIGCYCDGVPGQYLPSAPASKDEAVIEVTAPPKRYVPLPRDEDDA